jgi:hypothetical protein
MRLTQQHSHNKRQQERTTISMTLPESDSSLLIYLKIHPNELSVVLFIMVFACEACGSSFNSDRGRRRHQLKCEEFLLADNEASTVDDALEKYRRKLQRKKYKAALSEVSESLTGSGVCDLFILISILIIHHSL